jgi:site-specific recombinase XerD
VSKLAGVSERDPETEGFLALLAVRRAPRTVDAYRRDLERLRAFLEKPVSRASVADIECYAAAMRAEGLSSATLARRIASTRTFFGHMQLIGARPDNPAAAVALCVGCAGCRAHSRRARWRA